MLIENFFLKPIRMSIINSAPHHLLNIQEGIQPSPQALDFYTFFWQQNQLLFANFSSIVTTTLSTDNLIYATRFNVL